MSYTNHIKVWQFKDAPEELRRLSTNGGDEDWLALVPPDLAEEWIPWMRDGSEFGCFRVRDYPIHDGYVVRIGSHA